jgi:hypothetical protein
MKDIKHANPAARSGPLAMGFAFEAGVIFSHGRSM